ncbi:DUF4260 domain-containing protein [Fulvimarina sp. MAC8]|uniref:DUF4260 domain-containing protein n=1 Tax=Fulvimarina sp. MAC8 TaxID=3162874 RepID=UPI0032EC6545
MTGFATGTPKLLLRAEAAIVLAVAISIYHHIGASWTLFALLLLVPDLSMLGFLAGPRIGARVYNAAHWYGTPMIACYVGFLWDVPMLLAIGLIWIAHIAFDRLIGAGLKYENGFRFTHLGEYGAKPLQTRSD